MGPDPREKVLDLYYECAHPKGYQVDTLSDLAGWPSWPPSLHFMSYSHADEALRNELEKHLAGLFRQGVITTWHDRRIAPGEELHGQIDEYPRHSATGGQLVTDPSQDAHPETAIWTRPQPPPER